MQPNPRERLMFGFQSPKTKTYFEKVLAALSIVFNKTKALSWSVGFGSLFIFSQSYAVSLHNIEVNSHLGEPLDAIVKISAAPGETLSASCITTSSGDGAMPTIRGIQLSLSRSVNPGTLRLQTRQPIREPMSEIILQVKCAGAAHVQRNFLVMVDPVQAVTSANTAGTQPTPQNRTFTSTNSRIHVAASTQLAIPSSDSNVGYLVNPGSHYRVETNDTLSTIASRVEGRNRGTVWSWAATIQSANPHAFINGNPNELIAGSKLFVPARVSPGAAALTVSASDLNRGTSAQYPSNTTANNAGSSRTATAQAAQGVLASAAAASLAANSSARNHSAPTLTTAYANSTGSAQIITLESPSDIPSSPLPNSRAAIGGVISTQPMMSLTSSYSSVSLERINQRKAGLIQVKMNNLPRFNKPPVDQVPTSSLENPAPVAPNDTKPEIGVAGTTNRFFTLFNIIAALALAGLSFLAGMMLSSYRSRKTVHDEVEARLDEARYRARMLSGRRDRTEKVLNGDAAGIVVTETDMAIDTLAGEEAPQMPAAAKRESDSKIEPFGLDSLELTDANVADPLLDNSVSIPVLPSIDVDIDDTHAISIIDLELLEQDYAAQTTSQLEDIALAGKGNNLTDIMKAGLDMEFPDELHMPDGEIEATSRFEALDFETDLDPLGDDDPTGSVPISMSSEKSEPVNQLEETMDALGFDLGQAGAEIDAQLKEMEAEDIAASMIEVSSPTEAVRSMADEEAPATATRDAEEFYHLEASSIMHVGELSFEQDVDDETNILKFRQRNMKTGTDDSSDDS